MTPALSLSLSSIFSKSIASNDANILPNTQKKDHVKPILRQCLITTIADDKKKEDANVQF